MLSYSHHFTEYYEAANIDFPSILLKKAINLACKQCFAQLLPYYISVSRIIVDSFLLCLTLIFAPSVL